MVIVPAAWTRYALATMVITADSRFPLTSKLI